MSAAACLRAAETTTDTDLVQACRTLLHFGFTRPILPVLDALARRSAVAREARQLGLGARQLEKLGLFRQETLDLPQEHELDRIDGAMVRRQDPQDETLLLVFTGGANRFGLSLHILGNLLARQAVNIAYLRDLRQCWYARGVEGVGEDFANTVVGLDRMRRQLGRRRLLCLGNCTGGYGALRYGLDLEADAILCLSPRLRPARDEATLQLASRLAAEQGTEFDLRALYCAAAAPPRASLVFSRDNVEDAAEVAYLDGTPGLTSYGMQGDDAHDVISVLLMAGILPEVLETFIATGGIPPTLAARTNGLPFKGNP